MGRSSSGFFDAPWTGSCVSLARRSGAAPTRRDPRDATVMSNVAAPHAPLCGPRGAAARDLDRARSVVFGTIGPSTRHLHGRERLTWQIDRVRDGRAPPRATSPVYWFGEVDGRRRGRPTPSSTPLSVPDLATSGPFDALQPLAAVRCPTLSGVGEAEMPRYTTTSSPLSEPNIRS